MSNVRQEIADLLEKYDNLDALKAALLDWLNGSDGSLEALANALREQRVERLRERVRAIKNMKM